MVEKADASEVPMTPELNSLIQRYRMDPRFENRELEREDAIKLLTDLHTLISLIDLPDGVKAVFLTGSYSNNKEEPPRMGKPLPGPAMWRTGGSDMDIVLVFSNIIKLRSFYKKDRFENFEENVMSAAKDMGFADVADKLEIHPMCSIPGLAGRNTLVERRWKLSGTLLRGSSPFRNLGIRRDSGVSFRRPIDPRLNQMGGGF